MLIIRVVNYAGLNRIFLFLYIQEWLFHGKSSLWWKKVKSLSHVQLFATPWTVAYQTPQSMEFSRQEYWSGLPSPSPGDLPNPGSKPRSPALQADALPFEPVGGTKLRNSQIQLGWSHTGHTRSKCLALDSSNLPLFFLFPYG